MARDRLAVIGTGLIGGSVGLAARRARPDRAVVGFDPDAHAARGALERGAITTVAPTAAEAVADADLVVLAMPVDRMPAACEELEPTVAEGAVVTDVGSAKAAVATAGQRAFGPRFVGGHPMAGSERHGIAAADERLFEDAWWIVTPTPTTSHRSYVAVTDFVTELGATPVAVDPAVHDALLARLSHLPQLAASAIVDLAVTGGDRAALLGLAGPGFRDVTRIAASHPEMWVGIIRANRDAVLEAVDGLGERLAAVAELVRAERWDELGGFLDSARTARLRLFAKPAYPAEPVTLTLTIPDRPGVLAEVTTAAGHLGANIEELNIIHSTEGGRGRLELVIAGRAAAEALAADLDRLGYHVTVAEILE